MNIQEKDILNALHSAAPRNQRELAALSGHSLGIVNRCVRSLQQGGWLDGQGALTGQARQLIRDSATRRAVILAAGAGMRMGPLSTQVPKALLEIRGQVLIERTIGQLQAAGIKEIYVVVGFLKEKFEYLIDRFGVQLIVNGEYSQKNNLHSLALAREKLEDCYIVPGDLLFEQNPFRDHELYSWYMVESTVSRESTLRVNRSRELTPTREGGNTVIGLCYLQREQAGEVSRRLAEADSCFAYDGAFWDSVLFQKPRLSIPARLAGPQQVLEVNTWSQLQEINSRYFERKRETFCRAARRLGAEPGELSEVQVLKKGVTNNSYLVSCRKKQYVLRIPRQAGRRPVEGEVLRQLEPLGLSDRVVWFDEATGVKLSRYIGGAHGCDPADPAQVALCMDLLRHIHRQALPCSEGFDVWQELDRYEKQRRGSSVYRDYEETKQAVLALRPLLEDDPSRRVLCHLDPSPENFLLREAEQGGQEVRLIDWEHAALCEPEADLAMFAVNALYTREELDALLRVYYRGDCPAGQRRRVYAWVAAVGLLWSNWCELGLRTGVEFGEYSIRQYRYAKEFGRLAASMKEETL